jgi:hypothetical protein
MRWWVVVAVVALLIASLVLLVWPEPALRLCDDPTVARCTFDLTTTEGP